MARPFQTTLQRFATSGRLPGAVSGRLLGIHRGVLFSVHIHGQEWSYRSHQIRPDGSARSADRELIVFGGSILAFRHGHLVEQLGPDLDSLKPVDLAGQSRRLSARPRRDPTNGDLHLLATTSDGSQAHVVVSSGALTRRNCPIVDPPNPLHDLAVTEDHVVFAADGFLGIGARDLETDVHWIPTGIETPELVHAHSRDHSIVVIVLTPWLERWAIHLPSRSIDRQLLDTTPQRLARTDHHVGGQTRPFLWTIGDRTVHTYDLATGCHLNRSFDRGQPGDLAFVNDPARPHDTDGGWFAGFVHDSSDRSTELVLLDAADIAGPAVAAARIPGLIPPDLHTTWIPTTSQQPHQGDRS